MVKWQTDWYFVYAGRKDRQHPFDARIHKAATDGLVNNSSIRCQIDGAGYNTLLKSPQSNSSLYHSKQALIYFSSLRTTIMKKNPVKFIFTASTRKKKSTFEKLLLRIHDENQ